ncbi:hypothetical protein Scep_019258 [Stephania cephalantha]|uniref:Uncharacterized protein n=1 Tax=Stephania cephalantha TaxID=152367 RepID=A0AAP0IAD3_9MAGN
MQVSDEPRGGPAGGVGGGDGKVEEVGAIDVRRQKRTFQEGMSGRQDGKHYRFFRQLEALYDNNTSSMSLLLSPEPYVLNAPISSTSSATKFPNYSIIQEATLQTHHHQNMLISESQSISISSEFDTSSSLQLEVESLSTLFWDDASCDRTVPSVRGLLCAFRKPCHHHQKKSRPPKRSSPRLNVTARGRGEADGAAVVVESRGGGERERRVGWRDIGGGGEWRWQREGEARRGEAESSRERLGRDLRFGRGGGGN